MDLLWPHLAKKPASNNLRQTLHSARNLLDPTQGFRYLASEDEWLVLCPIDSLWVDVDIFEEAALTARRSRDVAVYRGALDLIGAYPDGVWLVELAPLSEGELVPQEVAASLEVVERPGEPLTDTLAETLSDKEMLVVLDNCEHLVEAAAQLVDALVSTAQGADDRPVWLAILAF